MSNEPHTHTHTHHNHHRSKPSSGGTNLASCIVATIFLIILAIALTITYFLVFKPKPPKISVDSVQFPTFSISNTNSTVNFTFFQFVSVTNPNRDSFTHYDSSLQLAYGNAPVGFIFIPAGKIEGGRTQHMSAKFSVADFPVPEVGGTTMEVETKMKLVGRVRVLKVFTHRVESGVSCGVIIQVRTGSVLGLHC
uniref:uncharacterized protein LOC122596571 n=1 Tax=Erigeron canadensis TaxID=72917 RepID=UPI001CB9653C|nr:uncharacterized protein LOC122596571 [Erigeron canadensis]